ncbi:hypothetical protein [Novosphingobium rosa]|uniref:hypothetical protein n=1 Tax=Novosphingobium rosa TaxID=76978 RepID=UPI0008314D08|nr:hypothetical protein [Novosphingobium rosa]
MIYPTATDLLRTIDATLADKVEPSLSDLSGRSALITVRHLLNFVRIRIEGEGQILQTDIEMTRHLIEQIIAYHTQACDAAKGATITACLVGCASTGALPYPSLVQLADEAAGLNELLHVSLAGLQELREERQNDAAYQDIRAAIRNHLKRQIENEGTLVAPAFFGRGPRR